MGEQGFAGVIFRRCGEQAPDFAHHEHRHIGDGQAVRLAQRHPTQIEQFAATPQHTPDVGGVRQEEPGVKNVGLLALFGSIVLGIRERTC